jgi:SAM-dependent methyltransferase
MDKIMPEPIIADSAELVRAPRNVDEMMAEGFEQHDNEYNRTEPGPIQRLPADIVRPNNDADLTPGFSMLVRSAEAPEPFVRPADRQVAADLLHIGCGVYHSEKLPPMFRNPDWREIRLDIDPEVEPDIVASITDMQTISDAAFDAVYSSHNLEHLYPHEVPLALREINRVLRPNGFAFIRLPDLQEVARFVAEGKLEDPLYNSPMGAIAPLDILYGHRPSLARGNSFMAHRTGFTGTTLGTALVAAGFAAVMIQRDLASYSLTAIAFRTRPDTDETSTWRLRLVPAADRPTVLYTPNN